MRTHAAAVPLAVLMLNCSSSSQVPYSPGNDGDGGLTDTYSTDSFVTGVWTALAAGGMHSLGLRVDGSLWVWGGDINGQLGDGCGTAAVCSNIKVFAPVRNGTVSRLSSIAAGSLHSVALDADGALWTWGSNDEGQLGDGCDSSACFMRTTPKLIGADKDWIAISAGAQNTLALKANGTLWSTGSNNTCGANCGVDPNSRTLELTRVDDSTQWTAMSAGAHHVIAIKKDGSLWTWGRNYAGQLGNGVRDPDITSPGTATPQQIGSDHDWAAIAGGPSFSVAIKLTGTLWHWGTYDPVGNCPFDGCLIPKQIGTDHDWKVIAAGSIFAVASKQDGSLWIWGRGFGQNVPLCDVCGNTAIYVPTRVGTANDWINITAGSSSPFAGFFGGHALGLRATASAGATAWGWGLNREGQVGVAQTQSAVDMPTAIDR
jgi:alpha-tubulin suppressor-like RCC1 family protein